MLSLPSFQYRIFKLRQGGRLSDKQCHCRATMVQVRRDCRRWLYRRTSKTCVNSLPPFSLAWVHSKRGEISTGQGLHPIYDGRLSAECSSCHRSLEWSVLKSHSGEHVADVEGLCGLSYISDVIRAQTLRRPTEQHEEWTSAHQTESFSTTVCRLSPKVTSIIYKANLLFQQ